MMCTASSDVRITHRIVSSPASEPTISCIRMASTAAATAPRHTGHGFDHNNIFRCIHGQKSFPENPCIFFHHIGIRVRNHRIFLSAVVGRNLCQLQFTDITGYGCLGNLKPFFSRYADNSSCVSTSFFLNQFEYLCLSCCFHMSSFASYGLIFFPQYFQETLVTDFADPDGTLCLCNPHTVSHVQMLRCVPVKADTCRLVLLKPSASHLNLHNILRSKHNAFGV